MRACAISARRITKSVPRPCIGQLERDAGFARDDTAATELDKLKPRLDAAAEPGGISLIAEMLSLDRRPRQRCNGLAACRFFGRR